eukprot:2782010-Alexandrium_andersonii.AAC.1
MPGKVGRCPCTWGAASRKGEPSTAWRRGSSSPTIPRPCQGRIVWTQRSGIRMPRIGGARMGAPLRGMGTRR